MERVAREKVILLLGLFLDVFWQAVEERPELTRGVGVEFQ